MKKIIFLTFLAFFISVQYSCTDEDKFTNPITFGLEKGVLPLFSNGGPLDTYDDVENIVISEEIVDTSNNISSYTLQVVAVIGGETFTADNFRSFDSFPAVLDMTGQDIAEALGLQTSDFGFGDLFTFIATVVRDDGVEFSGAIPTFDGTTLEVGPGDTEANLLLPGRDNAINFSFLIACPTVVLEDIPGMYTIITDDFETTIGGDLEFEIIAGPGENQFTWLDPFNHTNPADGSRYNVIMDVNVNEGTLSIERQDAWHCDNFGCGFGQGRINTSGASNLVLTCVGLFQMTLQFTVDAGSFGSFPFAIEKQ